MQYTNLQKLGIQVSKLGFGAMRLPMKDGEIDQLHVNHMVKYAFDNGVNYFDTAFVYGNGASERAMGKALKQFKREDFFVADKMPFFALREQDHLESIFAEQLANLDMDYIDFFLMHALDDRKVKNMLNVDAINWAIQKKAEGKIKYLGFSIHDGTDTLQQLLSLYDWDFVQIQYNYMDLDDLPGKAGYDLLAERNIPIIIMEPLKGGALVELPESITTPFSTLGQSNVEMAFRWLGSQEGIATVLSGMSHIDHVVDNVKVFSQLSPMKDADYQAIDAVRNNINASQKVRCTGCRYCMPCPMGVEIPAQFRAWNMKSMNSSQNWISGTEVDYDNISRCVECGHCTSHCPQHINIPVKLQEMLAEK